MPLAPDFLDILACPSCKGALQETDAILACKPCGLDYPVENGIPVLVIERARSSAS